tara:strand:+ start:4517 stop:5122 length:606 start_codon:yes stop_codon:yes gene_type:complete
MNIKSYLQIGLVIIIVIILSVFYYSFLKQNNTKPEIVELSDQNINLKKKTNKTELNNIEYSSVDNEGNSYYLNAQNATIQLDEDKKNEVQLQGVISVINLRNKGIIYINSKNATYNKQNHDTFFYNNVEINYLDNFIQSENFDLIFSEKISKIYNKVVFNTNNFNLNTDKVSINMISGDIQMGMNNKKDKVKFVSKYEFVN